MNREVESKRSTIDMIAATFVQTQVSQGFQASSLRELAKSSVMFPNGKTIYAVKERAHIVEEEGSSRSLPIMPVTQENNSTSKKVKHLARK